MQAETFYCGILFAISLNPLIPKRDESVASPKPRHHASFIAHFAQVANFALENDSIVLIKRTTGRYPLRKGQKSAKRILKAGQTNLKPGW